MKEHRWCPVTDFCMDCGLSAKAQVNEPRACTDDDHKTYLMARHRIEAMSSAVMTALADKGYVQALPETKH